MLINSINLQSRMAFGFNPYKIKDKPMSNIKIGDEILTLAEKGALKESEDAEANGNHAEAVEFQNKANFFNSFYTHSCETRRTVKEQIGRAIKIYDDSPMITTNS